MVLKPSALTLQHLRISATVSPTKVLRARRNAQLLPLTCRGSVAPPRKDRPARERLVRALITRLKRNSLKYDGACFIINIMSHAEFSGGLRSFRRVHLSSCTIRLIRMMSKTALNYIYVSAGWCDVPRDQLRLRRLQQAGFTNTQTPQELY